MYIDYQRLNVPTQKDQFPLPFIDQMLERLASHKFYYFLDGMSLYFQIPIAPKDQVITLSLAIMASLHIGGCPFVYVTHWPHFSNV